MIQIAGTDLFQDDAAKLSTSIRDQLPGREKEAKTEAKLLGQEAGAKVDYAVSTIISEDLYKHDY